MNTTLTHISLCQHGIRDEGAKYIADCLMASKCTALTSLDLSGNEIGITGGKHLAILLANGSILKELTLASCSIGDEGTKALAVSLRDHNETLRSLDISHNSVGEAGLVTLAEALMGGNTPISTLKVWGNRFSERSAGSFHRLFNDGRMKYVCSIFDAWIDSFIEIDRSNQHVNHLTSE